MVCKERIYHVYFFVVVDSLIWAIQRLGLTRSELDCYIIYCQGLAKTTECKCLLTSYSIWIIGDILYSILSSLSKTHSSSTLVFPSGRKWMARDILMAKWRTNMELNTLPPFNNVWKCLLDIIDMYITDYLESYLLKIRASFSLLTRREYKNDDCL
jgi:hypothetical protein